MFLGIDIHKREAQVAVRNDDGDVIEQVRVKNTDLEEIGQRYAGGEALLEATTNYFYIYDMLSEYLDVSVGHPPKLKAIAQTDKKTDRIDAKELSRLLWLGSVPESYVPTDEIRECRALVRGRISLLEERTSFANKIHSLLLDNSITRRVKPLSVKGREFLDGLSLPAPWDGLLSSYLSVIDTLTEEIDQLDERIEERAEGHRETQLLMTIPGISHYSALVIYAEIGEIDRFDRAKEVVRYVGLNPVIRESGDSRFEGSISKKGSGKVRWVLVQAVHSAVHTVGDEYLGRFYHRIERRKNKQKAAVATARKLLVSIYHMLDRGEVYDPPGVTA
jgi:transposase